jgi:hypothetical protein
MQWFKHRSDARHDPFIWDLCRRFGGDGYFVYFATLEIYAGSYRPAAGWFLDVSLEFLRHELGIYHKKKLMQILDFIRSWPDVDRKGYQPRLPEDAGEINQRLSKDSAQSFGNLANISPKWIVNLTDGRLSLLIPNFVKIMDEYSKKKMRQMGEMSGHTPDTSRQETRKEKEKDKDYPGLDIPAIFRDIAKDCEVLSTFEPVRGRRFPGPDFVGKCIRKGIHPAAIRDGTGALIQNWPSASKKEMFDPWAYAWGTAKSRVQRYADQPVDMALISRIFGSFFHGNAANH